MFFYDFISLSNRKNNYDYPDPRCKMADKMKNYIGY